VGKKANAPQFTCSSCGAPFTLPAAVLDRFPGWTPQKCPKCHNKSERSDTPTAPVQPVSPGSGDPVQATAVPIGPGLERLLERLLERHTAGPVDGVFTDGGCSGNPGPGGWGVVQVRGDQIVARLRGEHPATTNNRMELVALLAGYRLLGPDDEVTIWTDSQLCVNTLNEWAAGWAKRGWRRKGGPIKNLDLIRPLFELVQARPRATLRWLKAHDGSRWNEYVDLLATAHLR
jgi:ribonuclease HI